MSVLMNKDKTELIVTCKCGCDSSVHMIVDKDDYDTYTILSYMSGNFYKDQGGALYILKEKIKKILSILFNKDYYYADVCMNKDEFLQFRDYVNSIEV